VVLEGREYWRCPCCEEYKVEDHFGPDRRSTNGLRSWCDRCCREDARMRRAISGPAELDDSWRGVDSDDGAG
jgi:hypothetical protein